MSQRANGTTLVPGARLKSEKCVKIESEYDTLMTVSYTHLNRFKPFGKKVLALCGHKIVIGCGWNEYGKLDVRTLGGNVEGQVRVNDHRESADGDDVKRMRRLGRQVFLEVCRDTVLGHQIRLAKKNGICDSLRGAKPVSYTHLWQERGPWRDIS